SHSHKYTVTPVFVFTYLYLNEISLLLLFPMYLYVVCMYFVCILFVVCTYVFGKCKFVLDLVLFLFFTYLLLASFFRCCKRLNIVTFLPFFARNTKLFLLQIFSHTIKFVHNYP